MLLQRVMEKAWLHGEPVKTFACPVCGSIGVKVRDGDRVKTLTFASNGRIKDIEEWYTEKMCNRCLAEKIASRISAIIVPPYTAEWSRGELYLRIAGKTFGERSILLTMKDLPWETRVEMRGNTPVPRKITVNALVAGAYMRALRKRYSHTHTTGNFATDVALFSVFTETNYSDLVSQMRRDRLSAVARNMGMAIADREQFEKGVFALKPENCRSLRVTQQGRALVARDKKSEYYYRLGNAILKAFGLTVVFCYHGDEPPIMAVLRKHSVVFHEGEE